MEFILRIIKDTGKGIKGYIKSQLILMLITFIILAISLSIIQVPKAILISLGISILDILPIIGSGIVMIPWSIISFILVEDKMGMNLAIIYVVLIIIRQIIEPRILGKEIGIKPLYTFLATILGSLLLGPIGVILGPLIAVVINSSLMIMREKRSHKNGFLLIF